METIKPVIEICNLFKSNSQNQVLKGISLNVYPGQIIGYIGPNGAGKSTTLKIFCGLLSNFEGEVRVKGISVAYGLLAIILIGIIVFFHWLIFPYTLVMIIAAVISLFFTWLPNKKIMSKPRKKISFAKDL